MKQRRGEYQDEQCEPERDPDGDDCNDGYDDGNVNDDDFLNQPIEISDVHMI